MIVITAPTGNIGRHLLSLLLESAPAAGEELRVIARDPARLPDAARGRVEVVTGSHGDADVLDRAFEGADAVFWLVPPDASLPPRDAYTGFTRPAAEALTAHGVGHVVGVSALGRGTPLADRAGLVTASLAVDDLIAGTGVAYRALANPSFFENLLEEADSIREKGVFTDTVDADRKAPLVAVADIAAAAARLLLDRSWTGTGSVPVLGPQDLSADDLARIMTEQLGRPVRYERQPLDELYTTLVDYGLDQAFAQGVVDMKRAKDEGLDAGVARTPDTASPTTFEQWCARTLKPAVLS
ncbi:NAD(P)H-binding protein [Streptomyces sp. WP-1]|uniref:NAD(P)H-binding protein n=1 Tax=Streptomyces sp. WP-1 TaxID=3041497 RepID=UPI002648DF50|nr:NAD(P)H-binding protein [Streptomyces sp. WP-1]WKE67748.1 NAD(P)H-binding protein [Streptomyces sp. WP-1]